MSDRLSADELAEMVGCKPNQRTIMVRWLTVRKWKFEVDRNGLPIVMRAYRDRKLGLTEDGKAADRYADEPNYGVFQ